MAKVKNRTRLIKRLPQNWQIFFSAFLVVIWLAVIFLISHQPVLPGPDLASLDFVIKKGGHMTVYAVLYFLIWQLVNLIQEKNSANKTEVKTNFTSWFLPLLLCVLYAATDEFHQSFIPGRTATLRDIGFDTLGASITLLIIYGWI